MSGTLVRVISACVLGAAVAIASGCGPKEKGGDAKSTEKDRPVAKNEPGKTEGGDHDGWWCPEHELPEHVCDLCSRKYRESEKAKGNWCEHNRVKTSCFKCNPGLKEKYASEYKVKFGKEPPPVEEEKATEKK